MINHYYYFFFIIIDCSVKYCKSCSNDICSECISSYYFYENVSCSLTCDTTSSYYEETRSGSLYCNSKIIYLILD